MSTPQDLLFNKPWGLAARLALSLCLTVALPLAAQANLSKTSATSSAKPALKPALKRTSDAALIVGTGPAYAKRADAMALADEIAEQHALDRVWVRRTLGKARLVPQLSKLVVPPPVSAPRNWQQYRQRLLDAGRIDAGVSFWREHHDDLERASLSYGVPPDIIIGIIGVETYFGRHQGRYRVLDALATLALDFPAEHPRAAARTAFFRGELGEFLKQQQLAKADPLKARGSYAGAMGIPQFMPSSWAKYAVDFDGDGRIDLSSSPADAIGSVANYFKSFNWKTGMPTHYRVDFDTQRLDMSTLLGPDIKPTFDLDQFSAMGAVLGGEAQQHDGPLALIELRNGEFEPNYVAGTENFYVVTRYNWSAFYAMAVIELGQAVASARRAQTGLFSTASARP